MATIKCQMAVASKLAVATAILQEPALDPNKLDHTLTKEQNHLLEM